MALNFPIGPVEGQFYSAEGKTFIWKTDRWVVVGPSEGDSTTIVAADAVAGWQVWGDTLICWGKSGAVTNGGLAIPFPKTFAATPTVTAIVDVGADVAATVQYVVMLSAISTTSVTVRERYQSGTTGVVAELPVRWIAIGEALDADKLPKEVQTIGGSTLLEFYGDPSVYGSPSWRIIGNTLECWGFDEATPAGATITFPKTFLKAPTLTAIANYATERYVGTSNITTTNFLMKGRVNSTNATTTVGGKWHAIGQYDGIS